MLQESQFHSPVMTLFHRLGEVYFGKFFVEAIGSIPVMLPISSQKARSFGASPFPSLSNISLRIS